MRRGTTQAKTTKLLKEFRAAVPWHVYSNYFNRISRRNSGRFQHLERFCSRNETEWVVLPIRRKYTCILIEDDVPDTVKQDRANEIMELQSQISWDFKPRKVGTNI
jgi:ribosomal protein S12 methylthiotransferase